MADEPIGTTVSRRQFLTAAAVAATVVSLPVLQARADGPAKPDKPVDCGDVAKFAKDGVTEAFAKKPNNFFLIRKDGRLFASSALCTHKFFPLQVKGDDLFCPKHKSLFTRDGTVTDGPAKRSLPRYAIKLDDDKHVVVDLSKEFSEKDWEDPASFVKVGGK